MRRENMAVRDDIAEIRGALQVAESDPTRRNVRRLHNLLAAKMVEHKTLLGLSDDDIVAFGGGTPKDEDPE